MAYDFINQYVLTSVLCTANPTDSFFDPTGFNHTGYAFDGNYYSYGVLSSLSIPASWASEPLNSPTRGAGIAFPTQALVIVSKASMTIVDASNADLNLWMLFYFGDSLGYCNNFKLGGLGGYEAKGVSWGNGVLNVVMSPDEGSRLTTTSLTFDFVADRIYGVCQI